MSAEVHSPSPPEAPPPGAQPATVRATPPPAALEYDRTPNHVTRGQFRIFLILLAINTVAFVGYLWAPNSLTWARQAWKDYETKRTAKVAEQKKLEQKQK